MSEQAFFIIRGSRLSRDRRSRRICIAINNVAQIVQAAGCCGRPSQLSAFSIRESPPFHRLRSPRSRTWTEQRRRARTSVRSRKWRVLHGPRIIEQQRHTCVAKFGILFDLERQRSCRFATTCAGGSSKIPLLGPPASALLRPQTALQFAGPAWTRRPLEWPNC
jgi:hypothetical protein